MAVLRGDADAFGQALMDHHLGQAFHNPAMERDDGRVEPDFATAIYFADFAGWSPFERRIIRNVRGRVLDIGCGAGRVALHLQRKGHSVVGIDVSALAVKVCRLRGVSDVRLRSITEVDERLGSFGTIALMGGNLGLLGSSHRAPWLLRRLHRLTTDDGRIIGGSLDPYHTADPDHLSYHRWNKRRGRMPGQLRLRVRYRTFATPWFDYLFTSPEELGRLIVGTGWHVARTVSDPGNPAYGALLEKDR